MATLSAGRAMTKHGDAATVASKPQRGGNHLGAMGIRWTYVWIISKKCGVMWQDAY
jgi:hypothetical protein